MTERRQAVCVVLLCSACATIAGIEEPFDRPADAGGEPDAGDDAAFDGDDAGWGGVALTSSLHSVRAVAVDAKNLYCLDYDALDNALGMYVDEVPLAGGSVATLAAPAISRQIATDGKKVYWATWFSDGEVAGVSVAGGNEWLLAKNQLHPLGLATDGTNVYFTTEGTDSSKSDGAVARIWVAGGAPVTLASGQGYPAGIAIDATYVYWANRSAGTVLRAPKSPVDGGAPTTLASAQSWPMHVAVDSTSVYWTNETDPGSVVSAPVDGGAGDGGSPATLASGSVHPVALAVDASGVYFADETKDAGGAVTGRILRVPIGGGVTTTLAAGPSGVGGIALDATSVYWGTDTGRVMRIGKP